MNSARQQRSRHAQTSLETRQDRREQSCWRYARRALSKRHVPDLRSPPTPQCEYQRQPSSGSELTTQTDTTQDRPAYIGPDRTGFTSSGTSRLHDALGPNLRSLIIPASDTVTSDEG